MTRIPPLQNPTGKSAELLEMVNKKLGRIPNMMQTLATAPAALEMYLTMSGITNTMSLSQKDRERIALLSAVKNSCGYCNKAHSAIGKMAGLTDEEVANAKNAKAQDPKSQAILNFAEVLLSKNGSINDQDYNSAKQAGLTDAEMLETVAVTCLNIYTNFVNHVADPVIDF